MKGNEKYQFGGRTSSHVGLRPPCSSATKSFGCGFKPYSYGDKHGMIYNGSFELEAADVNLKRPVSEKAGRSTVASI